MPPTVRKYCCVDLRHMTLVSRNVLDDLLSLAPMHESARM